MSSHSLQSIYLAIEYFWYHSHPLCIVWLLLEAALESGDATAAQEAYTTSVPVIDRMADKGIIHKNKAARHKSRLNAKVKALAAK